MSSKGITGLVYRNGTWHIDKEIRGYGRLCQSTYESCRKRAEAVLAQKLLEIQKLLEERRLNGGAPIRTFEEAALRYTSENAHIRTIDNTIYHLGLIAPYINHLPLDQVHDGTLQQFKDDRRKQGVKNSTINATVEVVRRVLNAAARKYRDNTTDGRSKTWLATAPLLSMLPTEDARKPYPLDHEEQDFLINELPPHLQRMALFKVNTGTREEEVCELRWKWEVQVPELNTSVFIVPEGFVKNAEPRLIVLNRIAKSIIEECRGRHPEFVFVYDPNRDRRDYKGTKPERQLAPKAKARPIECMNNSAWQSARKRAAKKLAEKRGEPINEAYANVRVHDLKHTFGRRLRAAGVPKETRQVLLGHTNGDITTHYSAAEIEELLVAANKVCGLGRSAPTLTVLRVRAA